MNQLELASTYLEMNMIRKSRIALAAAAALALTASAAAAAPNIPNWAERTSEGIYRIPAGQTRMIERHGLCRTVRNNQDAAMMVPTGSSQEWVQGAQSFLQSIGSRASISSCPDYFYILQGCTEADHGRGECMIKPVSKRTLTSAQVRNHNNIPVEYRPTSECRVGSRNWGNLFFVGNFSNGSYRPLGLNGSDWAYYSDTWAGGGIMLDQNGSMVIPHANVANKLFRSTVNYSGHSQNSRMYTLGWPDNNTLSCRYDIKFSLRDGQWVDWGDYNAGGGRRAHSGSVWAGNNGASGVRFVLVRTPGVPRILTSDVIDQYMVDAPPDPPS